MAAIARRLGESLCLLSVLLALGLGTGQAESADIRDRPLAPWRIERDSRRFEMLNTDRLWAVLAVRPGMTILDIGTGTGQFAYAFAERLQGQGTVYATDVNGGCVDYVKEQAVRRRLTSIVPVLVKKEGLDEFYRSRKYDLIAIIHVRIDYEKEVDYLKSLKGQVADGGRLVLILAKEFPDFSPQDFTEDLEGLFEEILQEPVDSPFRRGLRESTRALLKASPGTESAAARARAVVEDFNAILADANFGMDFFSGSAFGKELALTPEERDYADWLTIPNNARSVQRGVSRAIWVSAKKARMINKLLIIQKYRGHLKSARLYTSGLTPAFKDAFTRAGYTLTMQSGDVNPFEDIVVYTPGK